MNCVNLLPSGWGSHIYVSNGFSIFSHSVTFLWFVCNGGGPVGSDVIREGFMSVIRGGDYLVLIAGDIIGRFVVDNV